MGCEDEDLTEVMQASFNTHEQKVFNVQQYDLLNLFTATKHFQDVINHEKLTLAPIPDSVSSGPISSLRPPVPAHSLFSCFRYLSPWVCVCVCVSYLLFMWCDVRSVNIGCVAYSDVTSSPEERNLSNKSNVKKSRKNRTQQNKPEMPSPKALTGLNAQPEQVPSPPLHHLRTHTSHLSLSRSTGYHKGLAGLLPELLFSLSRSQLLSTS